MVADIAPRYTQEVAAAAAAAAAAAVVVVDHSNADNRKYKDHRLFQDWLLYSQLP